MCVKTIEEEKLEISGELIRNVSTYHSVEFHKEHMQLWRNFEIGVGVKQKYTGVMWSMC